MNSIDVMQSFKVQALYIFKTPFTSPILIKRDIYNIRYSNNDLQAEIPLYRTSYFYRIP